MSISARLWAPAVLLVGCAPAPEHVKDVPLPPPSAASAAVGVAPVLASVSVEVPATAAPSAPAKPAAPCPEDMVDVGVACIDRYEAPNEKGKKPLLMQTSGDGDAWCAERGKRLCNEDEWVRACRGPAGKPYPYGTRFESGRCNDVGVFRAVSWKALATWPSEGARREVEKLDQSEPSGTREGCVSDEGVFDLTGNVAEWVVRTRENETNYSHVVKGCFWGRCFRVPHEPACDYVNFAHPAGFRSYEMGFRCCRAKGDAPK
jgi:sulfatase modifying factor 1